MIEHTVFPNPLFDLNFVDSCVFSFGRGSVIAQVTSREALLSEENMHWKNGSLGCTAVSSPFFIEVPSSGNLSEFKIAADQNYGTRELLKF